MSDIFMIGDCVVYVGDKIKSLNSKAKAWLHAKVDNEPGAWVVEYSDTKQRDSYIIDEKNLRHYQPTKAEKQSGPEVQPRHSRLDNDPDLD